MRAPSLTPNASASPPRRDFRRARKVLSGLDAATRPTAFTYGKDGRPCYTRGPDDDEARVRRICSMLEARCGPDGYTLIDMSADDDFEDYDDDNNEDEDEDNGTAIMAVRDSLKTWLDAEPPHVPRFFEFSGLLTALVLSPVPLMPHQSIEAIFGPEGPDWKSQDDAPEFFALLMVYWNHLSGLVQDCTAPDSPPDAHPVDGCREDFGDRDPAEEFLITSVLWARGFQRGVDLQPEAWSAALARADLAAHWELVRCRSRLDEDDCRKIAFAALEEAPRRTLARSVTALARALRPGRA